MKIITISREFGSGGRELGKRLADCLGFDYYDREIIEAVAQKRGMDSVYVEKTLENQVWQSVPLTFCHSFTMLSAYTSKASFMAEEKKVIEEIARAGKDCIIVGRNADVLLQEYHPFNIFVCADMQAKIKRCIERAPQGENLSQKELEQKIKHIDKVRKESREIISASSWGDKSAYHLIVNTTDWAMKELTPAVAEFAKHFFRRSK